MGIGSRWPSLSKGEVAVALVMTEDIDAAAFDLPDLEHHVIPEDLNVQFPMAGDIAQAAQP